ncbi:MAG TPA: metallopeptidase TldD-related protein [Thermoanaerobaculia bacterium]|jgi:predicted Zn-dependent protease|nr:metallopeptidase TldD-related protein [Thermoanaerobaculia bacterium]
MSERVRSGVNPAAVEATLKALLARGLPEVEVLAKRGRSRRFSLDGERTASSYAEERGWAVRAGDRRGSLFACGTGDPNPEGPWPPAYPPALRLPNPEPPPPWKEPSDFEVPLIGEREGLALLEGIARELTAELPRGRVLSAALEDGSSEGQITSSKGLSATFRGRLAALRLEAIGPGLPRPAVIELAEREARRFNPKALARRLADRLAVGAAPGLAEDAERSGDLLLAPSVAARLLAGLAPLFFGPRTDGEISAILGQAVRIGSEALTLVDDGRFPGGAFESPIDGEGTPAREVTIIERGNFLGPVLSPVQARGANPTGAAGSRAQISGIARRASFRDLPTPGPTHLYIRPDLKTGVGALLGSVAIGTYLIDALGPARCDFATGSFALPVCGLAVENGKATAPIGRAWLSGEISDLLRGIAAVGRDLAFLPFDGMIGSPTLLVKGLVLRGR